MEYGGIGIGPAGSGDSSRAEAALVRLSGNLGSIPVREFAANSTCGFLAWWRRLAKERFEWNCLGKVIKDTYPD